MRSAPSAAARARGGLHRTKNAAGQQKSTAGDPAGTRAETVQGDTIRRRFGESYGISDFGIRKWGRSPVSPFSKNGDTRLRPPFPQSEIRNQLFSSRMASSS